MNWIQFFKKVLKPMKIKMKYLKVFEDFIDDEIENIKKKELDRVENDEDEVEFAQELPEDEGPLNKDEELLEEIKRYFIKK